jgi:hypothetical protein
MSTLTLTAAACLLICTASLVHAASVEADCDIPPIDTTTTPPANWQAVLLSGPVAQGSLACFTYRVSKIFTGDCPPKPKKGEDDPAAQACRNDISHIVFTPNCVNATRHHIELSSAVCNGNCETELTYRDSGDTHACGWKWQSTAGDDESSWDLKLCYNMSLAGGTCTAWVTIKAGNFINQVAIPNGAPCCVPDAEEPPIEPPVDDIDGCPGCEDKHAYSSAVEPCNSVTVSGTGKCVSLTLSDARTGPACTVSSFPTP